MQFLIAKQQHLKQKTNFKNLHKFCLEILINKMNDYLGSSRFYCAGFLIKDLYIDHIFVHTNVLLQVFMNRLRKV